MFSRLVILSVMREIAVRMEKGGVDDFAVVSWGSECVEIVSSSCKTAQEARLVEDRLAAQVRTAFELMDNAR